MKRMITAALLPWLIVGAISAAVVGTAAKNMADEQAEQARQAAKEEASDGGIPELEVIPDLAVVEAYDPTRPNDPS